MGILLPPGTLCDCGHRFDAHEEPPRGITGRGKCTRCMCSSFSQEGEVDEKDVEVQVDPDVSVSALALHMAREMGLIRRDREFFKLKEKLPDTCRGLIALAEDYVKIVREAQNG